MIRGDGWPDGPGVLLLPGGGRVRGRRLRDDATRADFTLVLGRGPAPAWPHRRIAWPDFRVPRDPADAVDALREAYRRGRPGGPGGGARARGGGRPRPPPGAAAGLARAAPPGAARWGRGRRPPPGGGA